MARSQKRRSWKKAFVIVIALVVFSGLFVYTQRADDTSHSARSSGGSGSSGGGSSGTSRPCPVDTYGVPDFSNVKSVLEAQELVSELPNKGSVRLRFYHFAGHCRVWDASYILLKNEVHEENSAADIDMWVHSDYAPRLRTDNLCAIVAEADANGDLGRWTDLGPAKFTFRYGKLLKYKDCLAP